MTTTSTSHLLEQQRGEQMGRKVGQGVRAGKEGHTKMAEGEKIGCSEHKVHSE